MVDRPWGPPRSAPGRSTISARSTRSSTWSRVAAGAVTTWPSPGYKADEFAARFAAAHDARYGIAAMNGTVTLKVALRAAGVGPGDEVIVPPVTWIATAAAPLDLTAVPVFVDVDPLTGSLDPAAVEAAVTERTRAGPTP